MNWNWIGNLTLKQKFLIVIVPPLLACMIFGGLNASDKYALKTDLSEVLSLSQLAVTNSRLVHELQKERGMSAGFLGSQGKAFASKLPAQRSVTDREFTQFEAFLSKHQLPAGFSSQIGETRSLLSQLDNMRARVDRLGVSVSKQVAYYTHLNSVLLSIVDLTAKQGANQEIAIKAAAFSAYLQMKERAGIERAVLSSTFGQQGFNSGGFTKFVTLVSEQASYQERFLAMAEANMATQYQKLLASSVVSEVDAFRDIAFSQDGEAISRELPEKWFQISTNRIDALAQFEHKLAKDLIGATQERLSMATSRMYWVMSGLLFAAVFVILFSLSVMRFLHESVAKLYTSVIDARQNFDLGIRIEQDSKDEFGELAQAFNEMMADFERVIIHVRSSSVSLLNAVGEMELHATKMKSDVAVGHSEAEQVASAMTEMSATVSEIAINAVKASEASTEANREAKEGNMEVGRTSQSIELLASEISDASNAIDQLDHDIQGIVSVLDVISGIAEQTNLLALNAAIEAARAGESGRGFAVVADEVRSLAQRAQSATGDIKTMTDRLRSGADVAVKAIAMGSKQADTSVTEANLAGRELGKIVSHVGIIESMNEQIAAATHEQSAVSEEVNRNALKISDIYKSTQGIAEQLGQITESLINAANDMSSEVKKFKLS